MKRHIIILILAFTLQACGFYSFTGVNTDGLNTYQVNFFQNNAPIVEPGLDTEFTLALQDLIMNQTNLDLVKSNADLTYEGEITEYRVSPMSASADQTAAQNRLTMSVQLRYYNKEKPEEDFERRFSFFYDFPANQQLQSVKSQAHEVLFERITQDIVNATLANW